MGLRKTGNRKGKNDNRYRWNGMNTSDKGEDKTKDIKRAAQELIDRVNLYG